MHVWRLGGISLLLTILVPFCLFDDAVMRPGVEPSAAPRRGVNFLHQRDHVPNEWLSAPKEAFRDCKICHNYATETRPEQVCSSCHIASAAGQPSMQITGSVKNIEPPESGPFNHKDHFSLECRACHLDPDKAAVIVGKRIDLPSRGPRDLVDAGWCIRCHDPQHKGPPPKELKDNSQSRAKALEPGKAVEFLNALNTSPHIPRQGDNKFRHADHMPTDAIKDPSRIKSKDCKACHEQTEKALANDLGLKLYNDQDCGKCHYGDQAKTPIKFDQSKIEGHASFTDGTFFHSDHMRAKYSAADGKVPAESIGQNGCLACHQWMGAGGPDPAITTFGFTKKLEPTKAKTAGQPDAVHYDQCVGCHFHQDARWMLPKGQPEHGDVKTCVKCHELGVDPFDPKKIAPMPTQRFRPSSFTFKTNAHPEIVTTDKSKVNETCAQCHVAQITEIRSRLDGKRFTHDSHLGQTPTAADCAKCHQQDAQTGFMEFKFDKGSRTYDLKACAECHVGSPKVEIAPNDEKLVTNQPPLFSHNDHLKVKDGKPVASCADCHVPLKPEQKGPTADRDFAYAEKVEDCLKCHGHDAERAPKTSNINDAYTKTCAQCHRKEGEPAVDAKKIFIPQSGFQLKADRPVISGMAGRTRQYHPDPNSTAQGYNKCKECHISTTMGFTALADFTDQKIGNVIGARQGYANQEEFHPKFKEQSTLQGSCVLCHWGQTNNRNMLEGKSVSQVRQTVGDTTNFFGGR
jgi:hypothetical protein